MLIVQEISETKKKEITVVFGQQTVHFRAKYQNGTSVRLDLAHKKEGKNQTKMNSICQNATQCNHIYIRLPSKPLFVHETFFVIKMSTAIECMVSYNSLPELLQKDLPISDGEVRVVRLILDQEYNYGNVLTIKTTQAEKLLKITLGSTNNRLWVPVTNRIVILKLVLEKHPLILLIDCASMFTATPTYYFKHNSQTMSSACCCILHMPSGWKENGTMPVCEDFLPKGKFGNAINGGGFPQRVVADYENRVVKHYVDPSPALWACATCLCLATPVSFFCLCCPLMVGYCGVSYPMILHDPKNFKWNSYIGTEVISTGRYIALSKTQVEVKGGFYTTAEEANLLILGLLKPFTVTTSAGGSSVCSIVAVTIVIDIAISSV